MSKPKHTPGPWRVDSHNPGLVRINNDPTCGILVGQAENAKLVAAAPELLEALILARKQLREEGYTGEGKTMQKINKLLKRLDAV